MANYAEITAYELEQKYDSLANSLMKCSDEQVEEIQVELDLIQDELDSRDILDEED